MSATHSTAWAAGMLANVTAPNAAGTRYRAARAAPIATRTANRAEDGVVFRCASAANAIPQITIQARWAVRPAVEASSRGGSANPKPAVTAAPSDAKGPSQSLWRMPNPMIAPAVAAAATSPARTPTRIREEITGERKPRGRVHSSELSPLAARTVSGTHEIVSEVLSLSESLSIIGPMNAPPTFRTARILVVEDAPDVLNVLERSLTDNGYSVSTATDGEAGLAAALDQQPDLLILDIGLPLKDGYQVARELRARGYTSPVLMLTARDTVSDKVEGLDAGADDYLAKPFSYDELLARVRALLRRSALRADQAMLKVGDLVMDPFSRDVRRGNREINLTQKEYALLEYLARHAGRPVTREQISQHVWKQDFDPTTNIVDVYINYVRKKVDVDGEASLVQTVRGVGYMLQG